MGSKIQCAKIIGRTKEPNGDTVGKYNENPLFNSMLYDVDFRNGKYIYIYSAKIIAEIMYSQVDADGYVNNMLEKILYYKKDASTDNKDDMYITTKSGYRRI